MPELELNIPKGIVHIEGSNFATGPISLVKAMDILTFRKQKGALDGCIIVPEIDLTSRVEISYPLLRAIYNLESLVIH